MKLSQIVKPMNSRLNQLQRLMGLGTLADPSIDVLKAVKSVHGARIPDDFIQRITRAGYTLNHGTIYGGADALPEALAAVKQFDDGYSQWIEQVRNLAHSNGGEQDDAINNPICSLQAESIAHNMEVVCSLAQMKAAFLVLTSGDFLARLMDLSNHLWDYTKDEAYNGLIKYIQEVSRPLFDEALAFELAVLNSTEIRQCERLQSIQRQISPYMINKSANWLKLAVGSAGRMQQNLDEQRLDVERYREGVERLIHVRRLCDDARPAAKTAPSEYLNALCKFGIDHQRHKNEYRDYRDTTSGYEMDDNDYGEPDRGIGRLFLSIKNFDNARLRRLLRPNLRRVAAEVTARYSICYYSLIAEDLSRQLIDTIRLLQVVEPEVEQHLLAERQGYVEYPGYETAGYLDRALADLAGQLLNKLNTLYTTSLTALATVKDSSQKRLNYNTSACE